MFYIRTSNSIVGLWLTYINMWISSSFFVHINWQTHSPSENTTTEHRCCRPEYWKRTRRRSPWLSFRLKKTYVKALKKQNFPTIEFISFSNKKGWSTIHFILVDCISFGQHQHTQPLLFRKQEAHFSHGDDNDLYIKKRGKLNSNSSICHICDDSTKKRDWHFTYFSRF